MHPRDSCAVGTVGGHTHLGDPAGMEALASELLLRAESVAGIVGSLERDMRALTFEGPAAERLRDGMLQKRRRAERAATDLQESAHMLRRRAAAIRAEIYELELADRRARGEGEADR